MWLADLRAQFVQDGPAAVVCSGGISAACFWTFLAGGFSGLRTLPARCTQELQAKNAQLLAVTRQLGQDAERDKAQVRLLVCHSV